MRRKGIPLSYTIELRQRLETLPPRSSVRRVLVEETAELYSVFTPLQFSTPSPRTPFAH
jgi:hypothetical protein